MRSIKFGYTVFILIVFAALMYGCSDVQRNNPNDPDSSNYSVSGNVSPASGTVITGHEPITIIFDDPMAVDSLVLTGDMGTPMGVDNIGWTTTDSIDDTLTITPTAGHIYPDGDNMTLHIECESANGPLVTMDLAYNVEYVVYVRSVYPQDSDSNQGTSSSPKKTIQSAINAASTYYNTAIVRVAGGTYESDFNNSGARDNPVALMVERISIYGGYSIDFSSRGSAGDITTIVDLSTEGGSYGDPNRVIDCGTAISDATVIDGFKIICGRNSWESGIYCKGSPTIRNNNIEGRNSIDNPGIVSIGIYNDDSDASPVIEDNTIDAKWNKNSDTIDDKSYAVYNDNAGSVVIRRNYIDGGDGMNTYGILSYMSTSIKIYNNVIIGGEGDNNTWGVYVRSSSSKIFNNTIHGGDYSLGSCIYIRFCTPEIANNILINNIKGYGIYEYDSSSKPASVYNNDFYSLTYVYRDGTGPNNLTTIAAMETYLGATGSGNINVNPQFSGSDDGWHLGAVTPVSTGGLDGTVQGWSFTDDKDSTERTGNGTTGWSIGAYEYD